MGDSNTRESARAAVVYDLESAAVRHFGEAHDMRGRATAVAGSQLGDRFAAAALALEEIGHWYERAARLVRECV